MALQCPNCKGEVLGGRCRDCGQDMSAPRMVCSNCGVSHLSSAERCPICDKSNRSDMTWKLPLIIGMFVLSTILSIVLTLLS